MTSFTLFDAPTFDHVAQVASVSPERNLFSVYSAVKAALEQAHVEGGRTDVSVENKGEYIDMACLCFASKEASKHVAVMRARIYYYSDCFNKRWAEESLASEMGTEVEFWDDVFFEEDMLLEMRTHFNVDSLTLSAPRRSSAGSPPSSRRITRVIHLRERETGSSSEASLLHRGSSSEEARRRPSEPGRVADIRERVSPIAGWNPPPLPPRLERQNAMYGVWSGI